MKLSDLLVAGNRGFKGVQSILGKRAEISDDFGNMLFPFGTTSRFLSVFATFWTVSGLLQSHLTEMFGPSGLSGTFNCQRVLDRGIWHGLKPKHSNTGIGEREGHLGEEEGSGCG